MPGEAAKSTSALALLVPSTRDELLRYVKDDSKPKNLRHKALKTLLKLDPSLADELGGDFVAKATATMLGTMSGHDDWRTEVGMAKMAHEKAKLVGSDPDPVVSGYADRIVMCWLRVQEAELQAGMDVKRTLKERTYLDSRIERCQANYLSAMRALANYRAERDRLRMMAQAIEGKRGDSGGRDWR